MPEHLTPRADLPSPTEGDDVPFSVAFSDVNGNPIDITGWTVSLTIAERDATPIIEKDVTTHDNATAGRDELRSRTERDERTGGTQEI